MHNTKIHLCKDGSHTLFSEKFNQHYHNPNGAIAESRHVFFETPGMPGRLGNAGSLRILEVGFGTGLNLLLLMEQLCKMDSKPDITYRSVEAYPLKLEQAMKLNYPEKLELSNAGEILACTFRALLPGMNRRQLKKHVLLELFIGPFDRQPEPDNSYQMIFFDPFSPDVNADLWTKEIFRKLAEWSDPDVLLTTYGAASSARAAMAAAGWKVARAPGALGKREMTLAALNPQMLANWKRVNEEKLRERYESGEFG